MDDHTGMTDGQTKRAVATAAVFLPVWASLRPCPRENSVCLGLRIDAHILPPHVEWCHPHEERRRVLVSLTSCVTELSGLSNQGLKPVGGLKVVVGYTTQVCDA